MTKKKLTVSLFIPCLVDQLYPEIGMAVAEILSCCGYDLNYNDQQTCCGQPAFNAGHRNEARHVATKFIEVFNDTECIVGPSGSCVAMVRNYYPLLFKDTELEKSAIDIGKKIFEFSEFLDKEGCIVQLNGSFSGRIGFHNSCHSYRELGIESQPVKMLQQVTGTEIVQPNEGQVCCGFGGLFSFKYDKIAAEMAKSRLDQFIDLNVDLLVSNDPGCIMHMKQEAEDRKINIEICHLAEFLTRVM
jgi:L-lactate dehydrogenase complex protein LldE